MFSLKDKIKDVSYEALESLTRNRGLVSEINGTNIRFPARYSRYYESTYEPVTSDFLRQNCRQGNTFLDCGAHIGLFTVVGAKLVGETGKVFSFEPTPITREVLKDVVRINDCENIVEVCGEAISKESGTATFFDTGENASNANSLVKTTRHAGGLTVPTISIDDFAAERDLKVDVIKIDVEGAELDALRGAFQTLKNQRPPFSIGLHPKAVSEIGASLEEIWDIFMQLDYTVSFDEKQIEKDWFIAQKNLFDVQCYPKKQFLPVK